MVTGMSSLGQTLKLTAVNDQDKPEMSHPTETEQDQRRLEAEWVAHLDILDKGKNKGKGKSASQAVSLPRQGHETLQLPDDTWIG